ncbi:sulfotransferase family protein [Rubrivivax gelatinosus]|uniref:Sulfotransferase family protein n=1 Tax=Rubrivivax gelatinosus TaxID=28068 RepID=A0A4R2MGK1_RUBGE|nr:sulfotransferase [Rubrivivax gelatinosus]MBK1686098.1 hypothetical protein [Rubrivivax gelatinosus]TCP05591.1 sulfotransferase family protein [Rubrivivax gelatinosus]
MKPAAPVFVVGAPRSGTTLLQYMLRSHPALSIPSGESHFIVPLMRNETGFGDLATEDGVQRVLAWMRGFNRSFIETDLHGLRFDERELAQRFVAEGRHTMRDIVTGLFEANAAGEGKPRWGDKTPYYVLHMPRLLAWWPDARFIHIVRDGRDVALSLFARGGFGVHNMFYAARYWQQYVDTGHDDGEQRVPAGQYLELRYEDLIADPSATLRRVCDFLGIVFDEALLDFRKPMTEGGDTPLLRQPPRADNAGKWRASMTSRQISVFERAAGPTLRRMGYELDTSARPLPLPARALYRWHNGLVQRYHHATGRATWS